MLKALINTKQYRYEKKPFVVTNIIGINAVFQKKLLAKIKFYEKIYYHLLMFYYAGGLFHYLQRLLTRSVHLNNFFANSDIKIYHS